MGASSRLFGAVRGNDGMLVRLTKGAQENRLELALSHQYEVVVGNIDRVRL
jgi:hypothetical protein